MIQNVTPGAASQGPTPEQIGRAAFLLYFDELPDARIARELGVCRRTLARWKLRPDFEAAFRSAAAVGERLIQEHAAERFDIERRARMKAFDAASRRRRRG